MSPIHIDELADADIVGVYDAYEIKLAGLGDRFLRNLAKSLNHIATHPKSCGKVFRYVRAMTIKKFPYVIYFRLNRQSEVFIIAV